MRDELPDNDRVRTTVDERGIAHVRLVRADKMNAIDDAMFDAIILAGQALFDRSGVRCVVLSGEGRAFCAGIDLSVLQSLSDGSAQPISERTHGNANRWQQAAMTWRKLPVPVIAAVHGVCFGGGLQLASGADIRVVAPDARLAVLEMKWGIIPDMGGYVLWRDTVRGDLLRELTYTAREFSGDEAVAYGFATIAAADPLARAMAIAQDIATRNPGAIRAAKSLFNRHRELSVDDILMEESVLQQRIIGSRNQMEAVASQLEKRAPDYAEP